MSATPAPSVRAAQRSARIRRHPLRQLLVRRIAAGVLTLFVVSILVFLALQVLPGNAAAAVLGKNASPSALKQLEAVMGLNRPITTRYVDWLSGLLQGNLGNSATGYAQGSTVSVWSAIRAPLGNSLILAGAVTVVLLPLALILATAAAVRVGRPRDQVISVATLACVSLPEFILGSLLIVVVSTWLGLLPPVSLVSGASALSDPKVLILPGLSLLSITLGATTRMVRAQMIETLGSEYVQMARLNGISEPRVLVRYALRNALAPCVQVFAQNIQYLLGGIVVTEFLFDYPGIGSVLVSAVSDRDVTEVQSIVMIIAAFYIAINIAADCLVVLLVPKLRTS